MRLRESFPLTLALCIGLALAGCGGGGEQSTKTAAAPPGGETTTARPAARGDGNGARHPEQASRQKPTADAAPEPGTKSVAPGVPIQAAGDNSIQEFGSEGQVDQREQAIVTLEVYLNARLAGDWARACAATSREFKQQLKVLIAHAQGKEKPNGCAATLRLLNAHAPKVALRAAAQVNELLSFRVDGGYAYLIFKGAKGTVEFIAMANQDGEWKVNTIEAGEFPPTAESGSTR